MTRRRVSVGWVEYGKGVHYEGFNYIVRRGSTDGLVTLMPLKARDEWQLTAPGPVDIQLDTVVEVL